GNRLDRRRAGPGDAVVEFHPGEEQPDHRTLDGDPVELGSEDLTDRSEGLRQDRFVVVFHRGSSSLKRAVRANIIVKGKPRHLTENSTGRGHGQRGFGGGTSSCSTHAASTNKSLPV